MAMSVAALNIQAHIDRLRRVQAGLALAARLDTRAGSASLTALYQNNGTRAHRVVPKNRRALMGPGLRHPVRGANIPAMRGRYFVEAGAAAARGTVTTIVRGGIGRLFAGAPPDSMRGVLAQAGGAVVQEIQTRVPVRSGATRKSFHVYQDGRMVA